jgi:hypothetical protein
MAQRYYRYTVDGTLSEEDAQRAAGETGGQIVRVDRHDGATVITLAVSGDEPPAASSSLGDAREVSEEEALSLGPEPGPKPGRFGS